MRYDYDSVYGIKRIEEDLRRRIGYDLLRPKPLLTYAFDSSFLPEDCYETIVGNLDSGTYGISWIENHPFLFSLCLIRKFFEESDGKKYNLFSGDLRVNKLLNDSLGGILNDFGPDEDRRFNVQKLLVESLFFFGARTSRSYGFLSRIRQELINNASAEEACREVVENETSLPFAYYYLLYREDETFCKLLKGEHENQYLQDIVSKNLSKVLHDNSARINWTIEWQSKTLDILIERLTLTDQRIAQLKINEMALNLDNLRHYTDNSGTRRFLPIYVNKIFENQDSDLGLAYSESIVVSCGFKEKLPHLSFEKPVIFHKVGDLARQWVPESNKATEVIRASEIVLLFDQNTSHEFKLGEKILENKFFTVTLNRKRLYAYLCNTSISDDNTPRSLFVDDNPLCKVGNKPSFELLENDLDAMHSDDGILLTTKENPVLQLNTRESVAGGDIELSTGSFRVEDHSVHIEGLDTGATAKISYNKIKSKIMKLPAEIDQVIRDPFKKTEGHKWIWTPEDEEWDHPGRSLGELLIAGDSYRIWVKWNNMHFAWKKLQVGSQWEKDRIEHFGNFTELKNSVLEIWLPVKGELICGDEKLCWLHEGINRIRFDDAEIDDSLNKCFNNIGALGRTASLECMTDSDNRSRIVGEVKLIPTEPLILKANHETCFVYMPYDLDKEEWSLFILNERTIEQPVERYKLKDGRNFFDIKHPDICSWVILSNKISSQNEIPWLNFLVILNQLKKTDLKVLSFIPDQRAPLRIRLQGVMNPSEQISNIRNIISHHDDLFKETKIDAANQLPNSFQVIGEPVALEIFKSNLSIDSIEDRVEDVLRAGFNVFSLKGRYKTWIDLVCGKWTQGDHGTVSKVWRRCPFFFAMELLRQRFPVFGEDSYGWQKWYTGNNNHNQQYLRKDTASLFPPDRISLLDTDGAIHNVKQVVSVNGQLRIELYDLQSTIRPIYPHMKTGHFDLQLSQRVSRGKVYDIDVENIYPLVSENAVQEENPPKMYLSKRMYKHAIYEACKAETMFFSKEQMESLYQHFNRNLNVAIGRDKILHEILNRCYYKYLKDSSYSNRLSVFLMALISRRRCVMDYEKYKFFIKGMLRAYQSGRLLLMNDLIFVEFLRVWYSRKLEVYNESNSYG